ncbi:carboxypeptidase C prc1 [Clonorchis sinensis]|uniref:Carboxypeptidase C prc1 n=1 Tax=Clonorchis sinensis TaxID=79923 RepID=A0A3R7JHH5_CLOSI|nr:carboxypeptidase C prc1 [Clonorchis sinensis]
MSSSAPLIEQEILESIRPTLTELLTIWDYVGYNETERSDHLHTAIRKLRGTLEEVVTEENTARLETEHQVERKRREVSDLCQQLRLPAFLPDRGLSANDLLKILELKCKELQQAKYDRCEEYMRLRSRLEKLSLLLCEPADLGAKRVASFPPLTSSNSIGDQVDQVTTNSFDPASCDCVPDERELKRIREAHDELNDKYAPLAAQHASLMEDIVRISEDIGYEPESEQESELLRTAGLLHLCAQSNGPSTDKGASRKVVKWTDSVGDACKQTDPDIGISSSMSSVEPVVDEKTLKWLTEWRSKLVKEKARLVCTCEELRAYLTTMWRRLDKPQAEQTVFLTQHSGYRPETLEALQEEVDRCQQIKWEKLDTYLKRLTMEAVKLANMCCMDEKIVQLSPDQDSTDPEVVANHLETVLEQLNQTYSTYRPIFESIAAYEEQWQALCEVELRLRDPAIFSNRGGILLKTEKEKKRLQKEVQRAEQDVLLTIEQYELRTKTCFTLSDGRTFKEHVNERCACSKPSRESSRVRRSVVGGGATTPSSSSRPNSVNLSAPPGAPT